MTERHKFQKTHGLWSEYRGEYRRWQDMKQRCYNKKNKAYKDYGGRGIQVCESWRNSFACFVKDMGACPPKHSLDRIDNDLGYEPSNCRWATATQQNRNTRKATSDNAGVFIEAASGKWLAYIAVGRRSIRLGTFDSKDKAKEARSEAKQKYWVDEVALTEKGAPSRNNSSGYTGVSKQPAREKWAAYYGSRKTRVHIGTFDSAEEAHAARNNWLTAHGIKEGS